MAKSYAFVRFYFHLHNDIDSIDEEGRELPDEAAARELAEQDARDMAAESVKLGHLNLSHYVAVAGDSGETLFNVTFREAVNIID